MVPRIERGVASNYNPLATLRAVIPPACAPRTGAGPRLRAGRPRRRRASAARSPCPPTRSRARCRRARPWRRTSHGGAACRALSLQERLERGAEVGRGSADGIDVGAEADAVLEGEAIELVELLLGEGQRRGAARGQGAEHLAHLVLEVGVLVDAGDESHLRRLR